MPAVARSCTWRRFDAGPPSWLDSRRTGRGSPDNGRSSSPEKVYLALSPRSRPDTRVKVVVAPWQADAKHRKKMVFRDGVYAGPTVGCKREGMGTFWFANGDVYEGGWKGDQMHGRGRLTYEAGAIYEGEFQHGGRHGFGRLTYANGDVYAGNWVSDTKEGKGEFHWAQLGTRYEGDFAHGTLHGVGSYTFADGSIYQGHYIDGRRRGRGVLTKADGSKVSGEWEGLKRTLSRKQLMEEPPAFRPDLSFKRDPTKDYIEKTLAIEAWMEQLELEAQRGAFGSPTGEAVVGRR